MGVAEMQRRGYTGNRFGLSEEQIVDIHRTTANKALDMICQHSRTLHNHGKKLANRRYLTHVNVDYLIAIFKEMFCSAATSGFDALQKRTKYLREAHLRRLEFFLEAEQKTTLADQAINRAARDELERAAIMSERAAIMSEKPLNDHVPGMRALRKKGRV